MAFRQTFICNRCGYSCMISGGRDALMSGPTVPCSCSKCRNLVDVVQWIRLDESEPDLKDERCPRCQKKGGLMEWDTESKPCPRCPEGKMEIDPNGMAVCAD